MGAHTSFAHPQHRGRFCVHFLAPLPHLAAGGRHAFRLIASSVRTNFAEERGEVDFSPPLAQFGSTHAARLLHTAWVVTFISGARPPAPPCRARPCGRAWHGGAHRPCALRVCAPRALRGTQFHSRALGRVRAHRPWAGWGWVRGCFWVRLAALERRVRGRPSAPARQRGGASRGRVAWGPERRASRASAGGFQEMRCGERVRASCRMRAHQASSHACQAGSSRAHWTKPAA